MKGGTKSLVDIIYPIGSIYWSSKSTNPSTLFGGTWTQITDKFIYAAGTKAVNTTGGSETVTLSSNNLPRHTHDITHTHTTGYALGVAVGNYYGIAHINYSQGYVTSYNQDTTDSGDGGFANSAVDKMPPYVVKYCWERTA